MKRHLTAQNNVDNKPTPKKNNRLCLLKAGVFLVITLDVLGLSMSSVSAKELSSASISYGGMKNQLSDEARNLVIAQNSDSVVYDQIIGKAKRKTRQEIIKEKQTVIQVQLTENSSTKSKKILKQNAPVTTRSYTPEFLVYDALSFLEDDIDGDGYYQTFGVVFDVDVYNPNGNDESVIYAELYLSTDGINWEHYYTTDDFLIVGSSEEDQFEVITTFAQGYIGAHYDVLIDIYEVGYPKIVATYTPEDNNELYALPLESAEFDEGYVNNLYEDNLYIDEVFIHGGTYSFGFIVFISAVVLWRRLKNKSLKSIKSAFINPKIKL